MATEDCVRPPYLTQTARVDPNCVKHFGQIQRGLLMRLSGGKPFATEAEMKELSSWTALLEAEDDTKIVITPYFIGFVIPSSEGQFTGGNTNDTLNGAEEYNGESSPKPTGRFVGIPSAVLEVLRSYSPESQSAAGNTNLGMMFINRAKEIIHDNLSPFPITNWQVSTTGSKGLNSKNLAPFSFSLEPDWDQRFQITKPNFNPLTELDAPAAPVTPPAGG